MCFSHDHLLKLMVLSRSKWRYAMNGHATTASPSIMSSVPIAKAGLSEADAAESLSTKNLNDSWLRSAAAEATLDNTLRQEHRLGGTNDTLATEEIHKHFALHVSLWRYPLLPCSRPKISRLISIAKTSTPSQRWSVTILPFSTIVTADLP